MAINVTDASKLVVKQQQSLPEPIKPQITAPAAVSNIRQQAEQPRRLDVRDDGTRLYVNGKERKIGKKSQYLLDMLTLED